MFGQKAVLTSWNAFEWLIQKICLHGIKTLDSFAWHVNDVRMAWERHKREKFELSHLKCCKNCYINFSLLKTDDEINV